MRVRLWEASQQPEVKAAEIETLRLHRIYTYECGFEIAKPEKLNAANIEAAKIAWYAAAETFKTLLSSYRTEPN